MREELNGRRGNSERPTVKASTRSSPKTAVSPAVVKHPLRKKQGKTSASKVKGQKSFKGYTSTLTFLQDIKHILITVSKNCTGFNLSFTNTFQRTFY